MRLIGLAAPMRCGKDTVADYLVAQHDFLKFSFSDALYREVAAAYGLDDESLLRDAETKESDTAQLALSSCRDPEFARACLRAVGLRDDELAGAEVPPFILQWRSPRWVLQMWGTEYRRAQDPDYWINRANDFIEAFLFAYQVAALKDAESRTEADLGVLNVQGLVNTSVRFPNELDFIRSRGGEVWHIYRREAEAKHRDTYVSEQRLPVAEPDRELYNNSTIDKLHTAVSILLTTNVKSMALED
jgi:hypothetical protein